MDFHHQRQVGRQVRFELDSETQDPTDVAEYQQRETNKLIEDAQGTGEPLTGLSGWWFGGHGAWGTSDLGDGFA